MFHFKEPMILLSLSFLINSSFSISVGLSGRPQPRTLSTEPSQTSSCKAVPGSPSWPTDDKWAALNSSLSGALLRPAPPAAACYPEQPTYNDTECKAVQASWVRDDFHAANPISSLYQNWNNDSCPAFSTAMTHGACNGAGYPVYVVNASTKEHVKAGVDFARENNVRLNVKATGHDYQGRSTSPNSLSIWTRHLKGSTISPKSFTPQGCKYSIDVPSITFGAGSDMGDVQKAVHEEGLFVVSGGAHSVSYGGYIAGGGHSSMSNHFGMAADTVLEMETVSPGGEYLTLNECQNTDLFWAMRGGGGSTFGVVTSMTIQAWPTFPVERQEFTMGTLASNPNFFPGISWFLSQFPYLSSQGLTGYPVWSANTTIGTASIGGIRGEFMFPLINKSSPRVEQTMKPLFQYINTTWPNQFSITTQNVTTYPSFYDWWMANQSQDPAGGDAVLGSRLLPAESLTDVDRLTTAMTAFGKSTELGSTVYLLGGKGIEDAKPRGGGNAVNPAWRKAIIHCITSTFWQPGDNEKKISGIKKMTDVTLSYLRTLAPNSGAYVNEASPSEPNWQQAFWGANYGRLAQIKKTVDPNDVFWCHPCVGNEGWEEDGKGGLCRVPGASGV